MGKAKQIHGSKCPPSNTIKENINPIQLGLKKIRFGFETLFFKVITEFNVILSSNSNINFYNDFDV